MLMAFFNRKNFYVQYVLAFFAVIIGFSRVYLSQHFLEDILFGGVIGIAAFLVAFQIMQFFKFNLLNRPLFDIMFENQEKLISFRESLKWKN